MFNVYSLLDAIRARPRMYLGELSLTKLDFCLHGYLLALKEHGIEFERVGVWRFHPQWFNTFDTWISRRIGIGGKNRGFAALILEHTNGDEVAALALFWELLDEYRALEQSIDSPLLPEKE